MSEWSHRSLKSVLSLAYRYPSYYGIRYCNEDGVKEIRGELLTSDGEILSDFRFIGELTAKRFPKTRLEKNDIVMSVRGTLGKIGLVSEKEVGAVITANLIRLVPNPNIVDSYWLKQFFLSGHFASELDKICSQTTIKTIQAPQLLELEFDCPPLSEQRKIAEILGTVDAAIEQTQALIRKQEQVKQGLMADLLTRGVDENGEVRKPNIHAFIETEIGAVPAEWKITTLRQVTSSATDGPFGSNLKTEHYCDEGIRVVRLQNLGEGIFDDSDKAYISFDHARLLSKFEVVSGDLLIAAMGDDNHLIARACLYPGHLMPGIVKADCFRFRLDKQQAINAYIMWVLICPDTRFDLYKLGQGVTRNRINLTNVQTIRLRVPPIHEQEKIVEILTTQQAMLESHRVELAKLMKLKQGLMQDLLSGAVRVV